MNILDPFSFIHGSLNLLLVEDDVHYQDIILEFLEPVKIFTFQTVSSSSAALDYLKERKRIHFCILDLGISDYAGDEFYILRRYAHSIPCIVLTGSQSPSKGAACIQLGAKAVMEKGSELKFTDLYRSICNYTLRGLLHGGNPKNNADTLNLAIETLIEHQPATVTEWAEKLLITDRQMRNLWHDHVGLGAKQILELYELFSNAFNYYNKILFGEQKSTEIEINRSHAFFKKYQSEIADLLCAPLY